MVTKFLVSRKPLPPLETLARFTPFDRLSAAGLEQAAASCTMEEIPPGKLIFKPGLSEEEALFLVAGEITLISDNQVLDTVVADSDSARGELGAERPRQLWGWTTTRVTLLRADRDALRALAARARPKRGKGRGARAKASDAAAPKLAELQAQLASVEQRRSAADSEASALAEDLRLLKQRLEDTEAELARARDALQRQQSISQRLEDSESARQTLADELRAAREELALLHARVGAGERSPSQAAEVELPSLRIDRSRHAALAADELEAFRLTPAPRRRDDKRAVRTRERVDG